MSRPVEPLSVRLPQRGAEVRFCSIEEVRVRPSQLGSQATFDAKASMQAQTGALRIGLRARTHINERSYHQWFAAESGLASRAFLR